MLVGSNLCQGPGPPKSKNQQTASHSTCPTEVSAKLAGTALRVYNDLFSNGTILSRIRKSEDMFGTGDVWWGTSGIPLNCLNASFPLIHPWLVAQPLGWTHHAMVQFRGSWMGFA